MDRGLFRLLLVWNLLVFLLYAMDKARAKQGRYRVAEKTLLLTTMLFGGVGAFFGMYLLRHKTRKWRFRILGFAALLLTLLTLYAVSQPFPR